MVFNDARDPKLHEQIKVTCKQLGISCIKIPQEIHKESHDSSIRNRNVVRYSLEHYGFHHNGVVALFDSDMFLVKPFSIKEFMKNYDLAALAQQRGPIQYLWIGLAFLNMKTMPNKTTIDFNCGKINGINVDTGGYTHYYLQNNPAAYVHRMNQIYTQTFACDACCQNQYAAACTHNTDILQQCGFNQNWIKFLQSSPTTGYRQAYMEFLLDQTFLHCRSATNWDGKSQNYHAQKTKLLNDFIQDIIA